MNCPNCGTYNPEDRDICWRCDKPLPKPTAQKKRDPQRTARTWLYIAIAAFVVITILQTCGFRLPFGTQPPQEQEPSGYSGPRLPIARLVEMPWAIQPTPRFKDPGTVPRLGLAGGPPHIAGQHLAVLSDMKGGSDAY